MNRKRTEKLGLPLAAAVVMAMTGLTHAATLYDFEGQTKTDLDNAGWVFGEAADVNWLVTDDPDDATNDVLRQSNGAIGPAGSLNDGLGAYAVAPDLVLGTTEMTVDLRLDEAGVGDDAAVIFGWQDSDNYLFVLIQDGNVNDIFKVVAGDRQTIDDLGITDGSVATETWHEVGITHNPSAQQVIVTFNGSEVYNDTKTAYATGGQVGVGNFNDAASFDNLEIIPEPATLALLGLGGAVMLAGRKRS